VTINPVRSAKEQISSLVCAACGKAVRDGVFCAPLSFPVAVETPKERGHGDFSTNCAMQAARTLHMPPLKIAETICSNIDLDGSFIDRCETAGPGFINFFLSDRWYTDVLRSISELGGSFGRTDFGGGEKTMVEFVSANPTGPMHIGNARGGALGDALSSVLEWAGYDVSREFYINDAGNQIEKFFRSLDARYRQLLLGEDACEFPEDGYHGDDIRQRAQEYIDLHGGDLLEKSEQERKDALVGYALEKNIAGLREDLAAYRIHFDTWFRESSLYESGEVRETLDILKKNGYTYEKDGALWLAATRYGCEKDEVLVRANGLCTYFAADIAYHRNKFLRGFSRCINIWGADHHGHVARMKGALNAVGLDGDRLEVVLMQLVRLIRGDEVVKVSKRSGKAMSLRDLIDEIGIDAARFFFNLRPSDSHFDFDLDLAQEQSSQNPVYYVQYAHARICSIINHLKSDRGGAASDIVDASLLTSPEERELISRLACFPEEIIMAATELEPFGMTRYATDIAGLFHKFYNSCRVDVDDDALRASRTALCICTRTVIKNVLSMLSIDAPEHM